MLCRLLAFFDCIKTVGIALIGKGSEKVPMSKVNNFYFFTPTQSTPLKAKDLLKFREIESKVMSKTVSREGRFSSTVTFNNRTVL